ncbi:hypothetical protein ACFX1Q_008200 [Malus domestica]
MSNNSILRLKNNSIALFSLQFFVLTSISSIFQTNQELAAGMRVIHVKRHGLVGEDIIYVQQLGVGDSLVGNSY